LSFARLHHNAGPQKEGVFRLPDLARLARVRAFLNAKDMLNPECLPTSQEQAGSI